MRLTRVTISALFVVLIWAGGCVVSAAEPATPDAFAQVKRLGRGVNVIGYDPLWKDRSKGRFQETHFKKIAAAGFQHIRIPLHPFRDVPKDAQPKLTEDYLKTMDWAVDQALANKLAVILDFHEFQTMAKDPEGLKPAYLAMWRQIAERQRDRPRDVVFELLNEPNGKLTPELWNQYLAAALAVVRQSNPTRTVIVGPGQWNNINQLEKLELPADDRNLIVTVHYYSPFEFTHQGTSWTNMKDKTGVKWEATEKQRQAIEKDFAKAQAWATAQKRPLYLGEFGAYDKADMDSRVRWTSFVVREAERLGWGWGYWQFTGDFVLYDLKNEQWVEPILRALVPKP